jgi:hypothetical protein
MGANWKVTIPQPDAATRAAGGNPTANATATKPATHNGHNGQLERLPAPLQPLAAQNRWVVWKWVWTPNPNPKKQKWTKPPFQVQDPGRHASSADQQTWGSYAAAVAVVRAGRADGIGFMLQGSGLGAVDLDHCRDPKTCKIDSWAQEIIDQAPGAYVEVTVSGTGLRIIGRADGAGIQRKWSVPGSADNAGLEIYRATNRYITISGAQIGGCAELPYVDDLLDRLTARFDAAKAKVQSSAAGKQTAAGGKRDIDDIIKNGSPEGQRSQDFGRVVWTLAAAGSTVDEIEQRLSAYPSGIAEKYAPRIRDEIGRSYSKWHQQQDSTDNDLAEMNNTYAVVKIGGKTRVVEFEESPTHPGCKLPVYSTIQDFCAFHAKRKKQIRIGTGIREVGLGKWWIDHLDRRQYDGVVYAPNVDVGSKLNLWTGFACKREPGQCDLYLAHLRDNICAGNENHLQYLLNWMAYAVQHPGRQGEVAVVMRGKEGVGKGVAAKGFGLLFGSHFRHVVHAQHLTGHFNAHLQQCSVLYADESFFAGDRSHESILKALITEETLMIEPKGMDAFPVRNCIHLIMSSNSDWVIPAGADARRYFVLNVGDRHMQDHRYFAAIANEMDNGGRAALLDLLLKRDLSQFNVRLVPKTKALAEQKAHSRRGIDMPTSSMTRLRMHSNESRSPEISPEVTRAK